MPYGRSNCSKFNAIRCICEWFISKQTAIIQLPENFQGTKSKKYRSDPENSGMQKWYGIRCLWAKFGKIDGCTATDENKDVFVCVILQRCAWHIDRAVAPFDNSTFIVDFDAVFRVFRVRNALSNFLHATTGSLDRSAIFAEIGDNFRNSSKSDRKPETPVHMTRPFRGSLWITAHQLWDCRYALINVLDTVDLYLKTQ